MIGKPTMFNDKPTMFNDKPTMFNDYFILSILFTIKVAR